MICGLLVALAGVSAHAQKWEDPKWSSFNYPQVKFRDEARGTKGSNTYARLIPDPEKFIQQHALWVAQTLYWSDQDPNAGVKTIEYSLKDIEGVSAKSGDVPVINIFYSTRWIEKFDDDHIMYETRGVLYHELTHGYQLEPQGIGGYKQGTEYWAFIEGMADAVRIHNGFHPITNRKPGGSWMSGYQVTGFFLDWLTIKDPDFLRKFNKSAQEVVPWSFDKAMKHIFGDAHGIQELWDEYQEFLKR
jgi:hypothetical protein